MQAIIRQGGKQYLVKENDILTVAKIEHQDKTDLNLEVLAIFDQDNIQLGTPVLADAKITATIVKDKQGPKLHVYHFKAKSNYRRKMGYRDQQTLIQITSIKS